MNEIPDIPPLPAGPECFHFEETIPLHPPAEKVPIMVIDEGDDSEQAKAKASQVDADFAARPFYWKDRQLAAFAIDREGDWLRHRALMGDPDLDEIIRKPAAMLLDALRVLWFLAHDPAEWLSLPDMQQVPDDDGGTRWVRMTGRERAQVLEEKIRAWGREHIQPQEGMTAVLTFYDIYNRAHATRATAKPHEKEDAHEAKN